MLVALILMNEEQTETFIIIYRNNNHKPSSINVYVNPE